MGREFRECPDGIEVENFHINQIILALMGKQGQGIPIRATEVSDASLWALDARNHTSPGQHLRATHSSGSPVLFSVTDAGVSLSIAGAVASNPFVYPNMIVAWHGTSGSIPAGWAICDGTAGTPDLRDRFIMGAGSTYALNATGGAATYDVSHTHTGPSHTHSGATGSDGTGSTSADGTGNTSFDGTGATSSDGGGLTSAPSNNQSVTDDGTSQTNVGDSNHTHNGPSHTHSGPSHRHSGPSHTHSGPSHTHTISADGTGATGSSGSAAQSVLNPYLALYFIKRTTA